MFLFIKLVCSVSDWCDYTTHEDDLIQSRKNDPKKLRLIGSNYEKTVGLDLYHPYDSMWDSEEKEGLGQWLQYEFLVEKVKIKEYVLGNHGAYSCHPTGWIFEGSNDNSSFTILDAKLNLDYNYVESGRFFSVSTEKYYHVFKIKFISAGDETCDYISLGLYSITGTTESELFKPATRNKRQSCIVKRCSHSSLSYLIPLICISRGISTL